MTYAHAMQEFVKSGQTACGLEAQAVWKANELRLAKARERLLLAQLDTAEAAARQTQAQVRLRQDAPSSDNVNACCGHDTSGSSSVT